MNIPKSYADFGIGIPISETPLSLSHLKILLVKKASTSLELGKCKVQNVILMTIVLMRKVDLWSFLMSEKIGQSTFQVKNLV